MIKVAADLAGVQLTNQQLEELKSRIEAVENSTGEMNQSQKDLNQSVPEGWEAFKKYKGILRDSEKEATHLHASHRAMNLLMRQIGKETCPELGEALHAVHFVHAFGGIGAVMGLVMAWQIWQKRVTELQDALSVFKMPDLTHGLDVATQLGKSWKGTADAVKNAREEYEKLDKVFDRQRSDAERHHKQREETLKLEKEQELANLELGKGGMSEAKYKVLRSGIENYYDKAGSAEENRFEREGLAEKYNEQLAHRNKSIEQKNKASAVRGIPESEEVYKAQIEALNQKAKAHADAFAEATKQLEKNREGGGFMSKFRSVARFFTGGEYSPIGEDEDVSGALLKQKDDALKGEVATKKEIERREKLHEQRTNLQTSAAGEAGEAETLKLELPREKAIFKENTTFRNETTATQAKINTEKMVADITKGGTELAGAVAVVHEAHVANFKDIHATLIKQAQEIKNLRSNHDKVGQ